MEWRKRKGRVKPRKLVAKDKNCLVSKAEVKETTKQSDAMAITHHLP